RAGRRAPLHCTSIGKLYLGRMSDAEWRRYLAGEPLRRYTERTITDPVRLREETRRAAHEGFAATQEEFVLGVVGAAVLVTGPGSRVYAGVAFHAPAARLTHEDAHRLRPHLEQAAGRLVVTFEP
ncbi:MAG: IclR family transcriptional regulator, partial [Gammaproteobacteria bacterium]|nr:IclR family transcriptional regulator [Gammaproteobacteria bacterium]